MRIKLTESALPIDRLERNINKYIIPDMEMLGYTFDHSRTLREKYAYTYYGAFEDLKGNTIPFNLELSTASPKIDDPYQLFAVLYLGSKKYQLGAFHSKDTGHELQDAIEVSVPDASHHTERWNGDYSGDLIKSKDGREAHTEQEWKSLFKTNQAKLSRDGFARWFNNVYPDEVWDQRK